MSGDGRQRVIIEGVTPQIDCGRFPIKRTVGEKVVVEADAFTDGHDAISCRLLFRRSGPAPLDVEPEPWREAPMRLLTNDRWRGHFTVTELGRWEYTVVAWADHWKTWRRDLEKRIAAGQDVAVDLQIGAAMVRAAAGRATGDDARALASLASDLWGDTADEREAQQATALDPELDRLVQLYPDRSFATEYGKVLGVVVDRERARFSSWYEFFPRSTGEAGRHGTFRDAEKRLEYVAKLGFDIVYLPPIHPIGHTHRKGKNNRTTAEPGDVGSPWAIGAEEGGHKAVHPELGDLEGFRRFAARARELGMEVALDVAFQCSPDHPYVREHPEWFRRRPDGTIQYAENPPKKYEDIYPFDFETPAWRELWEELESVFRFWIEQGVVVFRVDNPHTKPFAFWEWAIGEIKRDHPEVIFLSEAFTRPKVMYRLAKLGFTQSYTYFAWRHTKQEFTNYLTELTATEVAEIFRPSFWPNTPDILTERLQHGGRPAFVERLILAATLAASYGIYGPAFELMEHAPRERGSEEYLDSEKYQLRRWDLERPDSLADMIALVNRIRRENPALQSNRNLVFHPTDDDHLLCYSKATDDLANTIVVVVNLDPHHRHAGWVDLQFDPLGMSGDQPYEVHDLLSGARYLWQGGRNYVDLDPAVVPAHVFRLRRRVRSEEDFDNYA